MLSKLIDDRSKLIKALNLSKDKLTQSEINCLNLAITKIELDNKSYLSLSQDCANKVSFYRNDSPYEVTYNHKVGYYTKNNLNNNKRLRTKLGRYFRRNLGICNLMLSDETLATINSVVFAIANPADCDIEILTGKDITQAYRNNIGGTSCMTGGCADYVELYELNPDVVSLLIYRNGVTARALLWNLPDGNKYIDRIYPNDGYHVNALNTWAESKGYLTRRDQSLPSSITTLLSNNKEYSFDMRYRDHIPYMDTFNHGEIINDNIITISNTFNGIELDSTNGNIPGESDYCCEGCACNISEDEIFYVGDYGYCEDCYSENFSRCDNCDESFSNDEIHSVNGRHGEEYVCECCRCNNFTECEDCGEYFLNDKITELSNGDCICSSCLEDNYSYCEKCEEYELSGDMIQIEDIAEYYCITCARDHYYFCAKCEKFYEESESINGKDYCEDCAETIREDNKKVA